jgi:arginine exporter protein ArgO
MLSVVISGLITGWAIAIPVGAIATFLVTLTARSSLRVGVAAGLGVATVDGVYASAAVIGGTALTALITPVADELRLISALILLGIASLTLWRALRGGVEKAAEGAPLSPRAAYALFVAITSVNPATVVYFAAIVLGNRDLVSGASQGVVFVIAAFVASASWQLSLAAGGAALARVVTSPRGRRNLGILSGTLIAGLALRTLLS